MKLPPPISFVSGSHPAARPVAPGGAGDLTAPAPRDQRRAFSLIEIMVTVGLLSFIVLGLVAMFSQTQRAFKTSLTQVDVMESGRSLAEILGREVAQMTPSSMRNTTNFMVLVDDTGYQALPGSTVQRTNVLQKFFFLSQINQDWTGIGYQVVPDRPGSPVGTLYRHQGQARRYFVQGLSSNFLTAAYSGRITNRVVDGVVHFKVTPYAPNGFPFVSDVNFTNAFYRTNRLQPNLYAALTNADSYPVYPGVYNFRFMSNALPAYVELEFGLLERQALERFRALPTNNLSVLTNFLANNVAQLHLFRQRVPIRNVDLSAYP